MGRITVIARLPTPATHLTAPTAAATLHLTALATPDLTAPTAAATLHLTAPTAAATLHLTATATPHRTVITDRPNTIGGQGVRTDENREGKVLVSQKKVALSLDSADARVRATAKCERRVGALWRMHS